MVVLICGGPKGAGMQETYQVTSALKMLPHCKHVAVITDARFSGVSTGACIGHVSPEALAGGPVGKVREGDQIEIVVDRERLTGTVNLVGDSSGLFGAEEGRRNSPRETHALICGLTRIFPMTRACGPRWCTPAAACGAAASTMPTGLLASWRTTASNSSRALVSA